MEEYSIHELYGIDKDKVCMLNNFGFDKYRVEENGDITVLIKAKDSMLNAHGVVHGGVIYAICSEAISVHICHYGRDGVGVEGSVHHYYPVPREANLRARVHCKKSGKRLGTYNIELRDDTDKLLDEATITCMYLK